MLRLMVLNPQARAAQFDWESVARSSSGFLGRRDAGGAAAATTGQPLVDGMCAASPEFAAMWRDNDVRGFGEGVKRLPHPVLGEMALE